MDAVKLCASRGNGADFRFSLETSTTSSLKRQVQSPHANSKVLANIEDRLQQGHLALRHWQRLEPWIGFVSFNNKYTYESPIVFYYSQFLFRWVSTFEDVNRKNKRKNWALNQSVEPKTHFDCGGYLRRRVLTYYYRLYVVSQYGCQNYVTKQGKLWFLEGCRLYNDKTRVYMSQNALLKTTRKTSNPIFLCPT